MIPTDKQILAAIDDVLGVVNNSSLMLLINSDIFEDNFKGYTSGDYVYEKRRENNMKNQKRKYEGIDIMLFIFCGCFMSLLVLATAHIAFMLIKCMFEGGC